MEETKIPFRPVRCAESALETMTPVDGHVIFTTDSRKIFLATNGEFKMMGGSSGVFYGTKVLTDDEKYGDQVIFSFLHDDIDGDELPASDDLILNMPDGGFYRVLEVNEVDIQAQRIAISGGGSGGGGGPSGPSNEGSLAINYVSETPKESSTITGVDYYIEFEIVAKDSAGDLVLDEGSATWIINGNNYYQKVKNGRNSFKVDEYLDPSLDRNKIVLMVSMNTGGTSDSVVSKTWYVKAVDLKLDWNWDYSSNSYVNSDEFSFSFIPYGGVDCTAHVVFDEIYNPNETYFTTEIKSYNTGREVYTNPMKALPYGAHKCEMYLTTVVNSEEYRTPSIFNEITFIKDGSSTILTVPYYETTATQYDTLNIPFLVYDPDQETVDVSFYVDDIRVGGDSYGRGLQHWPYTLSSYGGLKLTIMSDNEEARVDMDLVVNKLDLNVTEPTGYKFALKANNFSSNSEIQDWKQNGVKLSFSENFDWKNGGLKTETLADGSIQKYILVRQGTRMTIDYKPFHRGNSIGNSGLDFKFCFKAINCYDYEAPVMECYDDASLIGITMDAQKAYFAAAATSLTTQYYENSYIELESEIWQNDEGGKGTYPDNPGDRFMMFWVDGVPVGIKAYEKGSLYFEQTNEKNIVIGSDLCDVCVYLVKVYERKLTENEHLDGFILDAPNANEMMRRYNRNDIVDNSGEISYEKLVQKNPDCHAYVYRIPKMTTSKEDKVGNCDYFELYGEHNTINNPYYKAINEKGKGARIRVQGTSSAAYGVAAFNLRTEFQEGLLDKDGNKVDGWKCSETAIPIDYVCTKVNVASCENANNVVNAEWYNKYQPYHDGHRRKPRTDGNVYRDCMEFNSGVIFVLDENSETDWHDDKGDPSRVEYLNSNVFSETYNYTSKPYYKMYSIGNMGNDKKNSEVFHDVENPLACCVEVTDNQNAEHHMTVPTDMSTFDLEDLFYEFRYPDGNEKASNAHKQAWVDFVNWMAASNPKGGNDEHILTAERVALTADTYAPNTYYIYNIADNVYTIATGVFSSSENYYKIVPAKEGTGIRVVFEPYTFKGFDPPGYEGKTNPTGISLKGTTIKTYSTTKVTEVPKIGPDGEQEIDENGNPVFEEIYTSVPYTHDTYEYRMAKMLAECEEHIVMDSVMFHYLYIQRHTMVDNVAKNTFWSSEDCKHWDLTKNYDNDTSDGNNNSGYLTYTYGIEPFDMELDDNGVPANIFNASDSVWFVFMYGLYDAQKALYNALWSDKGAWSAEAYLNEFKKHQGPIPERCWIYDYFRKYIRPRRLGLDEDTYLKRLEGGKKEHQRTQYETYQSFYIDSKYVAGTSFNQSTSIDMRLNYNPTLGWDKTNTIPVSYYIDCYSSSLIGGRKDYSGTRIKRGDIYEIPVGEMLANPNDATCYIYGGRMVQSLSGLSVVYPSYAVLSEAKKLREIELGSDEPGYYNARLATLSLGSNEMLQNVYVQNSGKSEGFNVDLTGAVQLQELKLNGSTAKILKLADGSIIELMYLNGVTDLTMTNATSLNDIRVDDTIYENLRYITVKNSPAFDQYCYNIALRAPVQQYVFNKFTWTITENNEDHFVIDENGQVVGIKVLEKLLAAAPQAGYTTGTALEGTLVIDVDCNIDEYDIYEKYSKQYPNLIIEYTDKVTGLNPAVEIIFKSGESDTSTNHYRVLGSGDTDGDSIGVLISAEGPTGVAITDPSRGDTSENTYSFTGYWKDKARNKYYVDGLENPVGATNFNEVIPTTDMTFYPEFLEDVKKHEIKFFDYDGNVILQNGKESFGVPYGMTYTQAGGPMTNFYYKDSSNLPDDRRYGFKGWSTSKFKVDEGKNIEFIDLETYVVEKAMNLYPYYVTENVYEVASNEEYFEIINGAISIKDEYKASLEGKITIPNSQATILGKITTGLFGDQSKITHVYFLNGSKIDQVSNSAFAYSPSLKVVDLPDTVRVIDGSAFASCKQLVTVTLNDNITTIGGSAFNGCSALQLTALPRDLVSIGASAFQSAGAGVQITSIPDGIESLPMRTFSGCSNVKISEFGSSNTQGSKLKEIGINAFYNGGNGDVGPDVTSITIHSSVEIIDTNAFKGYANKATEVRFVNGADDYSLTSSEMGFRDPSETFAIIHNYIPEA